MTADRQPVDQDGRDRIRSDLASTLFVEAGAGSGKTAALVDRIEALVLDGARLLQIAAITFTEKAAAELRDRIRRRLEEASLDEERPPDERDRCRLALGDVDGAAIATLHAFAQRLLTEDALAADLPPGVEVLDEIGSQTEFDDRWDGFLDALYDRPDCKFTLQLGDALGIRPDHLRQIAQLCNNNWDLVAERIHEVGDPVIDIAAITEPLERGLEVQRHCVDHTDKLSLYIDEIAALLREWREGDPLDAVAAIRDSSIKPGNVGRAGCWEGLATKEVRDHLRAAHAQTLAEVAEVTDAVLRRLAWWIRGFTLDSAETRRRVGRLEFHDLLVLARRMLRDPDRGHEVRTSLRDRYRHLLLDEFQDTDPIQIELALLIAATPDQRGPWPELDPDPGRVFFVGDPKQSIYRFRRADIGLFLDARSRFGPPVVLDQNFRSTPPVIGWVNRVFGGVFEPVDRSQPEYRAQTSFRRDDLRGPGVLCVRPAEPIEPKASAADLREVEAAMVADAIQRCLAEGWEVTDRHTGVTRTARLGDIAILLPARTSLPFLERALEAGGIPFRAEASSMVWAATEIRELVAVLRAIDDPTDELALVSALRSSAFGCGDDDLVRFRLAGGRWAARFGRPDAVPENDPVWEALVWFEELRDLRQWLTPSELVERVVRDRRLLELAVFDRRPRDRWRHYRFVVDQARAFVDSTGAGLRAFLHWVTGQTRQGVRVVEGVLPETDDDSVRVLTIHAAKGLEFPITVLSGLTTQRRRPQSSVRVVFPPDGGFRIRIRKAIETSTFDEYVPLDEQLDRHEQVRLLYVGATRARDHLVVPLVAKAREGDERASAADLLTWAADGVVPIDAVSPNEASQLPETVAAVAPAALAAGPFASADSWRDERDRRFRRARSPGTLAATTIATRLHELAIADPGLKKQARDLDLPPWLKGRYGTAVGRAVHGVLQTIDLVTGDGLVEAAAAQAEAEGAARHVEVVERLVRSALATTAVAEAAATSHWRELYVAAPVGDRLVEGYVDLLYRRPDGLVVVDYKTDAADDDATVAAKVGRYLPQMAAYALAIEAATGERVVAGVFAFLAVDGAIEAEADGLADAMAVVSDYVRSA